MPRKRAERLPPSVYLAFFTIAAKAVRAAGFPTCSAGGVFTRQEMDRMDEWCERGETAESFGAWIIQKRADERRAEQELESENIGNETIAPSEVAA